MHYNSGRQKCIWFTFILLFSLFTPDVIAEIKLPSVSDELISDLYMKYKEAAEDDSPDSTRRLFAQNRQYRIHVRKLKEVNGLKTHNLMIKEEIDTKTNPLIYINNPVESKFPNAYLTLEEFKRALINRVEIQRQSLTKQSKLLLRTPKEAEVKTSKRLSKKDTATHVYSKTANKKISSTKPYNNPILKSTLSEFTSATNRNITDRTKISKTSIPSTTSTIVTSVITKQIYEEETNKSTVSLKENIETTTEVTAFKENLVTNTPETFISTDSLSINKQNIETITTEDFTKEQSTEETATTETSTETVPTEATRKTRRTLGRPLVFMGSHK